MSKTVLSPVACVLFACAVFFPGCARKETVSPLPQAAPVATVETFRGELALALLKEKSRDSEAMLRSRWKENKTVQNWSPYAIVISYANQPKLFGFGLLDPSHATDTLVKLQYPIVFLGEVLQHRYDVGGIRELSVSLWTEDCWYPELLCRLTTRPLLLWCQGPLRGHGPEPVVVRFDPQPAVVLRLQVPPDFPSAGLPPQWYILRERELSAKPAPRCDFRLLVGRPDTGENFPVEFFPDGTVDQASIPEEWR